MARILLQTTIPYDEDDWNVGRFSLLRGLLAKHHDVEARDKRSATGSDPVLAAMKRSDYDQLWLIAVDTGDGLTPDECRAISDFRRSGGGLFVTRDHMDLGSSICDLDGVGLAHHFHTRNPDPDESFRTRDDAVTTSIDWPNFHSGSNGDVQTVAVVDPAHPVMRRRDGSALRYFPAHPHEGDVGAPKDDPTARVIARGRSQTTGRDFNLVVAFDSSGPQGNAIAESTFHHIADYNWDTAMGCPSFVGETPGTMIAEHPELLDDVKTYCLNVADFLSR